MTPPGGTDESHDGEEIKRYSVRFSIQASQDAVHIAADMADRLITRGEDPARAQEWLRDLYNSVGAALATLPRRFPSLPSNEAKAFGIREVRRMLYPPPPEGGQTAVRYKIYFTLADDGSEALDGPVVTVVHIRHASKRPPTRAEVISILANQ